MSADCEDAPRDRRRVLRRPPPSWALLVLLATACRSGPDPKVEADLARGIELVERGELDQGIELLRAVLAAAPDERDVSVRARSWIGTALTRAGDPEGALRECEVALELAPDDPWLHYCCGVAWYKMGELEHARDAFTRGLASDPRHIKSLQWRALVLRDLDDDRAAITDLTRALECIESAEDSSLVSWGGNRRNLLLKTLNLRLLAYDDLGQHDEAERDRQRYAQIFEGNAATAGEDSAPRESR